MDQRWLGRADVVAMWLLGACLGAVVDMALMSALRVSPVLGNPLRDVHGGALDVIGWLILGAPLRATLMLARSSRALEDLPGWALLLASPIAGLAMTWGWTREWRHAWLAPLSLLAALVLPALERSRAGACWRPTWVMSMSLIVLFLSQDPGHGIARSAFPRAVVWWIGVAACGAGLAAPLWRSGLRLSAMATTCFWSCAFWSLLANSREVSKFSVGLLGVVWRSSGWHRCLGPQHAPPMVMDFVWPSVPMLVLLLVVLHRGPWAITLLARRGRAWLLAGWARIRQHRRCPEVPAS